MPVGKILYQSLQWKSLQFLTSLVVNIVFARVLHAVVAGEFYSLVYLLSLIISFFTLGLDISLNYYLSRKEMNGATARRIIVAVILPALAISVSLLLLFHPSRFTHVDLSLLLLLASLHIAGGLLTSLAGALFAAAGKNHIPARIGFIANVLLAGACLYSSVHYTGTSLIHALFCLYFIFSFGQGLLLFFLSYSLSFATRTVDSLRLSTVFRFSFFAFLTNFIFFMAARLYVYMLPYYLSPYEQGNYIQAYKLVEYMGLAMSFMYYPFIALVAGGTGERMKDALFFLVRLSNTVVLVVGLTALFAGHWIFPFLFGPSFGRMYSIFGCFIPGLFAVCSSSLLTAWYFGSGHIGINFISACIQLVTMPLFFFLFTGAMGVEGPALGFSLSSLLSLAYDLWIFRKYFRYTAPEMLLIRKTDWKVLRGFVRGGGVFLPSQR